MKNPVRMILLGAMLAASAAAFSVHGQGQKEASPHKIIHYGDLKWSPILPGAEVAAVAGDSTKAGELYVIRIKMADGAKIPPHWHPMDENVTVLKGSLLVGMGDAFDETKLTPMNTGNFLTVTKELHHFAMAKGETIVQVHGVGPFKVNFVNPADDPANAGAKAKP